jgi:hypothetical protein
MEPVSVFGVVVPASMHGDRQSWIAIIESGAASAYPQGVETKANKVFGTREWAELEARRMIERRLDGKSRQRARPEAVARRKFE